MKMPGGPPERRTVNAEADDDTQLMTENADDGEAAWARKIASCEDAGLD